MQTVHTRVGRRQPMLRTLLVRIVILISWFVAPLAHADCATAYTSNGAYPGGSQCVFDAVTASYGGDYSCGNTDIIAAYCGGATYGTTVEPSSPDESVVLDGDAVDGSPGGAGGCGGGDATAGCGSSTSGGDPVRLYTGQFHLVAHDLHIADTTIALDLARVYRSSAYDTSGRPMAGAFGIGSTFNYDSYLTERATDGSGVRQLVQLYLPSGIHVPFAAALASRNTDGYVAIAIASRNTDRYRCAAVTFRFFRTRVR
jgi:hypothetical protein